MKFTLRQLAVFDAIARVGSVSKAAAELHMTQSAASMALRSLEEAFGKELFLRQGKGLSLAEPGRLLQPMARSILGAAEEMQRAISADSPREELLIGASPTVSDHLLDDVVTAFMARHPHTHVNVSTLPATEVIQRVDDLALDVGLIEMVTARPTLRQTPWRRDVFSVFCAPEHPLAGRSTVTSADLAGQSWCLQQRFADSRREFTYALLTRLDTIDVILESDSINVIKAVVAAGIALGCLPRPCVAHEIAEGTLAEITVSDLDLRLPFSVITRRGLQLSPAHLDFVRCATQTGSPPAFTS